MKWSPQSPLCLFFMLLTSWIWLPPLLPSTLCFAASLYLFQVLFWSIAHVYFTNVWYEFYVSGCPTAKTSDVCAYSVSLCLLFFPSSLAGMWAATWGPGDKCRRVSWEWPGWPVAGSCHTANQRGICQRCYAGPCRHLLWLRAQDNWTGECVDRHLQVHTT